MGQERFADVVERFTSGFAGGAGDAPAETIKRWQEDDDLTVEECVTRILPRMARRVLEASGTEELSVLGYCMGAPISAACVATHPEVPVKNFVNMAGPIDFAKVGLFGLWLGKQNFNVDLFVDTLV